MRHDVTHPVAKCMAPRCGHLTHTVDDNLLPTPITQLHVPTARRPGYARRLTSTWGAMTCGQVTGVTNVFSIAGSDPGPG